MNDEYHIICLDDDDAFLSSLKLSLQSKLTNSNHHHYNMLFINNPLEALKLIDELNASHEQVALLITDQMMPEMKGIDFLREAKKKLPESIKVLLTGYAGLDSAVAAINDRVLDKYLTKPIEDIDDLTVTLKHLLNEFQLKKMVASQHQLVFDLYEFGNALNAMGSLDDTLRQIISFAGSVLKCQRASILLIENNELVIKSSIGIPEDISKNVHIPVGEKITGKVFQKQEAILVKDINDIPWLEQINPEYHSFISVPIIYAGLGSLSRPLGVINATNRAENLPFEEDDLRTLAYIANTASIAINNQQNHRLLEQSYFHTIKALVVALEARDNYTKGHSVRVMELAAAMAVEMGMPPQSVTFIRNAAILHDIGKIGIRDDILQKPGKLTPDEYAQIREHPRIGEDIIKPLKFFTGIQNTVRHHHERYDGKGYPDGVKEKDISLEARILAVADSFDAMISDRPYRKGLDLKSAMAELQKNSGSQFDPQCVEALLKHLAKDK